VATSLSLASFVKNSLRRAPGLCAGEQTRARLALDKRVAAVPVGFLNGRIHERKLRNVYASTPNLWNPKPRMCIEFGSTGGGVKPRPVVKKPIKAGFALA
jgi:hypothetical protein